MRRSATALLLPLALGGCQDLLLDPGQRITGDYDTEWTWTVDVSGTGEDDRGTCRGRMELVEDGIEEFEGRHELPPFASCLPRSGGRVVGEVERSGRVRMVVELPYGDFGVFGHVPDCTIQWADNVLIGTFSGGRLRADAEALYRCRVFDRWRDVRVRLELEAVGRSLRW